MNQQSFTDFEYSNRKKKTRREKFLEIMDSMIPWTAWIALILPYYLTGKRGRPVKGIETMLRMYLMQNWFKISDEGVEDAIYDSYAMRSFMHLDFSVEQVPDATTLLKFRHLLEKHDIGKKIFADVAERLDRNGLIMHGGIIVDATIVNAPSSTKNREGKRDPEMHQTQKGNQWYHGMKAHIGVDAGSGFVHSVTATPANASDISEAHKLLRDDDEVVYADAGYTGLEKRKEIVNSEHHSQTVFRINQRPGRYKTTNKYIGFNWEKDDEHRKSAVRCKAVHAFLIVKNQFGYSKVVYRGLAKKLNRFNVLFACANIVICARSGSEAIKRFCMG